MSRTLLHDWECSIEKNRNNTEELLKIAEDIYNTAYARGKASEERPQGDLISRSELKKALCEFMKNNIGIYSNEMFHIVDSMPTVEEKPQGEWIPVSERLPEQNGVYITTCQDICENRVHAVVFDGVRKKWGRGGVIAWQSLPDPYKEGKEE